MQLQVTYDRTRDIKNYYIRSTAGAATSRRLQQYQTRYGSLLTDDNLNKFIDELIIKENIDIPRVIERIIADWQKIAPVFLAKAKSIFKVDLPDEIITAYLTTHTVCSYYIPGNWFCVSDFFTNGATPNAIIMHELLHFFTWYGALPRLMLRNVPKKMYEDIKESLTVLLELEFNDLMAGFVEPGYPPHQQIRAHIRQYWLETPNLYTVLDRVVADLNPADAQFPS